MAGPNYQFWECVVKMDAGRAVCKFCDLEFGKGTTITRIKSHLSGLTRRGIRICNKVPVEIEDAARAALPGNVSSRMPTGEDLGGAQETTGEATQTEDQVRRGQDPILACFKEVDGKMKCKFCGKEYAKTTSSTRFNYHLSGMKGGGAKACEQAPPDVKAALAAKQLQIDGSRKKRVGSSSYEVTNAISTSAQQQEMELQERGGSHERPSINKAGEPQGDSSQQTDNQLFSPSVNNNVIMGNEQNIVGVRTETMVPVLEQSDEEPDNLARDVEGMQEGVQSMEQGAEKERICLHLEEANALECTGEGSTQHVERNVSPYRFTGEATQTEDRVRHLVVKPWDVMAAEALYT
uniref:BED-type domain-containing protein n=1 Tax=Populus davidiana TaxID=266767 RepID=A0A6M2E9T2_9ROSI